MLFPKTVIEQEGATLFLDSFAVATSVHTPHFGPHPAMYAYCRGWQVMHVWSEKMARRAHKTQFMSSQTFGFHSMLKG